MTDRRNHSQRAAAARAGFSERTARRRDADPRLPSQRRPVRGRTVPDPPEAVWEPVLVPILERDPAVQAVTLLRHLQLTDPGAFTVHHATILEMNGDSYRRRAAASRRPAKHDARPTTSGDNLDPDTSDNITEDTAE